MIPTIHFLMEDEQLVVQSLSSTYVVNGPRVFFKPFFHSVVEKRNGTSLQANEYAHIKNRLSGELRMVKGPLFFFCEANEEIILHQQATPLRKDQYVEILSSDTGKIHVIRGECSYMLKPFEAFRTQVKNAVHIDEHTAVIVRNILNGDLRLITQKQVFCPSDDEVIHEIREKTLVEEHEVVVLQDENSRYHFRFGNESQSSFFVPPYWKVMECHWSSGIHKNERKLHIKKFDLRPKFMWYSFDIRTRDNVELTLEVTFFWQVQDVEKLVRTTDDASGDVCSHARSQIIQKISKVDFSDFLSDFNEIVKEAVHVEKDSFYEERGLKIHSVEVREISCKDQRTQDILSEIIQETTTRLNRIQKQISENEVELKKIEGKIVSEENEMKLLRMRMQRFDEEARAEGRKQALLITEFVSSLDSSISAEKKLHLFELLRKKEMMESIAGSNSRIFLTPADIDLKIDVKD